ncbi:MAG: hypothetical protein IKX30_04785 [Victivallales bacterium]|nr:hypothetical protein [Victivallales bacterium]
MKCCDCGKEMLKRNGYSEMDENVGVIKTDGEYWECPECGCQLVSGETLQKVDDIRKERTDKLLWACADSPSEFSRLFIRVKEVAEIMGISRQAVEKSVFLKDLVYNITVAGVRYWLKESVERYKETGNGRFPLEQYVSPKQTNGWIKSSTKRTRQKKAATPVLSSAD